MYLFIFQRGQFFFFLLHLFLRTYNLLDIYLYLCFQCVTLLGFFFILFQKPEEIQIVIYKL